MAVINTNLTSLTGQHHLGKSKAALATSMERLASGLRVNSAKDDAAGQAIGNRMQAQSSGLNQAARNANDGVSLSQTAQGVLDSINEKLQRIRELTVQGLNGTVSTRDSDVIQAEINFNLQEIDRLAETAHYNGVPLMTGQAGKVDLQVGANDGQKLAVDLSPPGFSVQALGLEGLNIAGIDGEVTERNTLRGVARDIPLYDPATTLSFDPGTERPLYYSNSFGYYTSDGSGGFSRVSVTATHNTETDSSQVSINTPRPIFSAALATEAVALPDLPANQRLIQQDDTYYLEERLADGSLSYRQAGFSLSYAETMEMGTLPDGSAGLVRTYPVEATLQPSATIETGTYTDISDAFTFGGENYSLAGAGSVSYLSSSGDALSSAELTEDSSGDLYIRAKIDGEERFFQLNSVTATGDTPEQLVLQADLQGFAGINLSGLPTLIDPETPATDLSTLDASNITFNGDFTGLGSLAIVQREADGQWMVRGQQADGSQAYFEADLDVTVDANGDAVAAIATATQTNPDVLGMASHERDRVSGYSEITIDPRNVSVQYTDAKGQQFEDVLRQGEDGNYYFSLPGESAVIGGYKTATLVDLEGTNEVVLRTSNGNAEVLVYYPSNVSSGNNFSIVALTDADGFNDDGVPHTRLQIRENGDDFRLRVPRNPLAALDKAIGMVDSKRSYLGATENRLASVIEGNQLTATNLTAAQSRIMDADYAVEVANMTRAQILQQAGTSVLAQANQVPQSVLSLLG
jgi:flagellin-like hook-associated protein FlgL